jgi:hypothetical protein
VEMPSTPHSSRGRSASYVASGETGMWVTAGLLR